MEALRLVELGTGMILEIDPTSNAFAAELSPAEVGIVSTIFAVFAVLLTILILKTRDRNLAKKSAAVPQGGPQTYVRAPTAFVGMARGVTPLTIPGYCPNCGIATRPNASFCERCGRRLLQG